jgi:hypothetical protein
VFPPFGFPGTGEPFDVEQMMRVADDGRIV